MQSTLGAGCVLTDAMQASSRCWLCLHIYLRFNCATWLSWAAIDRLHLLWHLAESPIELIKIANAQWNLLMAQLLADCLGLVIRVKAPIDSGCLCPHVIEQLISLQRKAAAWQY